MSTLAPVTARFLDKAGGVLVFEMVGICRYFATGLTFFIFACVSPCLLLKGVVIPLADEKSTADVPAEGDVLVEGSVMDETVGGVRADVLVEDETVGGVRADALVEGSMTDETVGGVRADVLVEDSMTDN